MVRDLAKARASLQSTLGVREWSAEFQDPINGVTLQFGRDGSGMCYELLVPFGPSGPLHSAAATGRAILNHVAYRVTDLAASGRQLRDSGYAPTATPKPAIAYGGRNIQFFVSPLRFIVELIEAPDHQHVFAWAPRSAVHGNSDLQ